MSRGTPNRSAPHPYRNHRALGTFALGIAEFVMMGILSPIAHDLDVSIVDAGHLISAYALGVSFGAPMLLVLRKMPLKKLLVILDRKSVV